MESIPSLNIHAASEPSTSSGPLLFDEVYEHRPTTECSHDRPLSPTIFTNGRTPVNISAKHLKNHPLHEPTGTSEVLTFYPTIEEFRDFSRYIKKIEQNGGHLKAGIAKIVAPEGWTPRPRKDMSDVESYEITQPARETIEAMEKPGAFFKRNITFKRKMPVKEFKSLATSALYRNPHPNLRGAELEQHYFANILKGEPIYGADTEGSFWDENVNEWNMNRLGTILEDTGAQKIKGVNTVYLYFGMYKTTFPWHAEDMDLYSINFLHFGAPKYWFAISSEHADRFERFMSQMFSYQSEYAPQCKAFLRHKTYIVTPELLRIAKIPYATMIQNPNEFIITFPRGYHMGFNLGYNLAESTNFASDRWIDYGKDAVLCDCNKDSVKIDMSHFMYKYRRDEYDTWWAYWFGGGRLLWQPKKKKEVAKKRRGGTLTGPAPVKRARLGSSVATDGSCSEGSSGCETEGSSFMHSLQGYTIQNYQMKPDCDELMRKYKKDTKLLRSDYKIDFYQEREYNMRKSHEWPHCAVCQYFQPEHMKAVTPNVPEISRRLTPYWCFSKAAAMKEYNSKPDHLLTCCNCNVTVHSQCCSGDQPQDDWKCVRCRDRGDVDIRSTSCHFCELRGGVLIPCQIGRDSTWAHVICAVFNRRAAFDKTFGPSECFAEPAARQFSTTDRMPMLGSAYRIELGDLYEDSRWECVVCRQVSEGLTPCELCIEEQSTTTMPTVAHPTCAKRVGFLCEPRDFPRCAVLICHKHEQSHLVNKQVQGLSTVKAGDDVYVDAEDAKGEYLKGNVVRHEKKETVVVDFMDSSVSRDNTAEDIQSCECLFCENGEHQYGSRVRVVWDDKQVYDSFYRGKGVMTEYTIRLHDGREVKNPRNKLKTKREMNALLRK